MALIKCPECGREISDKAISCPGCGCPVEQNDNKMADINIATFATIGDVIVELNGNVLTLRKGVRKILVE